MCNFCLVRDIEVVQLDPKKECGHYFCCHCMYQIHQITMLETRVRKMVQRRLIRCPKCNPKSSYLVNLEKVILNKIRDMCQQRRFIPRQKKAI